MIFAIKEKSIILTNASNLPVRRMTAFGI